MKVGQFKKLIRQIVKEEMELQQRKIITEMKSELFDLLVSRSDEKPISENISNRGPDRSSLRAAFNSINEPHTPPKKLSYIPTELPKTFEGNSLNEEQKKTLSDIMTTDYASILKKMGIND